MMWRLTSTNELFLAGAHCADRSFHFASHLLLEGLHLLLERLAITVLGLAFVGLSLAGGLLLLGSLSRGAFFVTRGLAAPFWLLLLLLLLHIFAIGALLAGAACARAVLTSFLV